MCQTGTEPAALNTEFDAQTSVNVLKSTSILYDLLRLSLC